MSRTWQHHEVCRVAGLDGDPAALGGAVTVALCGHWEHDGPCRWEHFTESEADGDGDGDVVAVTVHFDASAEDVETVRQLVRDALAAGSLTGPDGTTTTWRLEP